MSLRKAQAETTSPVDLTTADINNIREKLNIKAERFVFTTFNENTLSEILSILNNATAFEVKNPSSSIVKITKISKTASERNIKIYKFINLDSRQIGNKTSPLTSANLELIYFNKPTAQDIEEDPSTEIFDFGDLGTTEVIDAINSSVTSLEVEDSAVSISIFKGIVNGSQESYLYVGSGGIFGDGFDAMPLSDLELLEQETQVDTNLFQVKRTNVPVTKTNDTYTLQASDVDKHLLIPAPCTVIVPNGFPANLEFEGVQIGVGDVEFVAESGGELKVNEAFQNFTEGEDAFWGIRTYGSDEAGLEGQLRPLKSNYASINITTSRNIVDTDRGKTLIIDGTVTLTFSGTYLSDLNFNILVKAGGSLTISNGDKILLDGEQVAQTQIVIPEKAFVTITEFEPGTYILLGL